MKPESDRPLTADLFDHGRLAGATLAIDAVASKVCGVLRDHSVPSIVLRGPGISRLLYDSEVRRWYDDVDLLVPPGLMNAAQEVLAAHGLTERFLGFAPGEREPHSYEWITPGVGVGVDLHLTIVGVGVGGDVLWDRLTRASTTLELPAGPICVPADGAQAAIVALHAAHHGRRAEKPLRDLDRALERLDDQVWMDAVGIATQLDAVGALSAGLQLRQEGVELAERLAIGQETDVMSAIRAQSPPPTALGFARLAATNGLRARLAMLVRKLIPTVAFMRHAYPAAQHPGGIVIAYLWRPIRLLVQAGPGLLAWRRATRRVKASRGH